MAHLHSHTPPAALRHLIVIAIGCCLLLGNGLHLHDGIVAGSGPAMHLHQTQIDPAPHTAGKFAPVPDHHHHQVATIAFNATLPEHRESIRPGMHLQPLSDQTPAPAASAAGTPGLFIVPDESPPRQTGSTHSLSGRAPPLA